MERKTLKEQGKPFQNIKQNVDIPIARIKPRVCIPHRIFLLEPITNNVPYWHCIGFNFAPIYYPAIHYNLLEN